MGSGLDLPVVSNSSRRACHRPPRDGAALASCRLPGILALEIEAPTRPAQCSSRGSSVDPRDEYCQSVVGHTAEWQYSSRGSTDGPQLEHWAGLVGASIS